MGAVMATNTIEPQLPRFSAFITLSLLVDFHEERTDHAEQHQHWLITIGNRIGAMPLKLFLTLTTSRPSTIVASIVAT